MEQSGQGLDSLPAITNIQSKLQGSSIQNNVCAQTDWKQNALKAVLGNSCGKGHIY